MQRNRCQKQRIGVDRNLPRQQPSEILHVTTLRRRRSETESVLEKRSQPLRVEFVATTDGDVFSVSGDEDDGAGEAGLLEEALNIEAPTPYYKLKKIISLINPSPLMEQTECGTIEYPSNPLCRQTLLYLLMMRRFKKILTREKEAIKS